MIRKVAFVMFAVAAMSSEAFAAPNVDVSFKPGAWSSNDWIVIKGPRWDYKH